MLHIHSIVFVLIPFISHVVADQQLSPLSFPMEERRLEEVLSNLHSEVKKRRLLMYPYYRDYDMVGGRGGRGGEGRGGEVLCAVCGVLAKCASQEVAN